MKLEVTRGIECGERGYGDESGECGFRGEWKWWRWMWFK